MESKVWRRKTQNRIETELKRPLGRPRRRWEDNIRMDLEETGINAGNYVDLSQDTD